MQNSQQARAIETLMAYQPIAYHQDDPPRLSLCCTLCAEALLFAKDLFATAVTEVINSETIPYTISIDLKHAKGNQPEITKVAYPGKDTWVHTIRCYNHTRADYILNAGITIVYKPGPHTKRCEYAKIVTDLSIRRNASSIHQSMFRHLIHTLGLFSRRFAGPGTTLIEKREGNHISDYLITTTTGLIETPKATPGFQKVSSLMHSSHDSRVEPVRYMSRDRGILAEDDSPESHYIQESPLTMQTSLPSITPRTNPPSRSNTMSTLTEQYEAMLINQAHDRSRFRQPSI